MQIFKRDARGNPPTPVGDVRGILKATLSGKFLPALPYFLMKYALERNLQQIMSYASLPNRHACHRRGAIRKILRASEMKSCPLAGALTWRMEPC